MPLTTTTFRWSNGKARYTLYAEQEPDYSFLPDIRRSSKRALKITLHFQEDDSKTGLLRIDYHEQHRNPLEIKNSSPDRFKPYAGKWFDYREHHLHYYVEGYTPLAWAIPLVNDDFPLKTIRAVSDIFSVIQAFSRRINLKTEFREYQHELAF